MQNGFRVIYEFCSLYCVDTMFYMTFAYIGW